MQHLFISFTALVRALFDQRVTDWNLANGIFYFGCARNYLLTGNEVNPPVNEVTRLTDNSELQILIMNILREAVLFAEKNGRAAWREENGSNNFEQLQELLEENGIKVKFDEHEPYSYPAVKRALEKVPGVIVVF